MWFVVGALVALALTGIALTLAARELVHDNVRQRWRELRTRAHYRSLSPDDFLAQMKRWHL